MFTRIFPRRTAATPTDSQAFVGEVPRDIEDSPLIAVSCTFSWDKPLAEKLADEASRRFNVPVVLDGPAYGHRGGPFTPGVFLKEGYVVTSRGCPNHCWFCDVPKREGSLRELPITEGWNVLDPNLLACSTDHIVRVFSMLKRQPRRPEFTGGLEAKRITPAIATALKHIKTKTLFCAYDTPDDLEPLMQAGKHLLEAGFTRASHTLRAYVLCGWKADTFEKAEKRMRETIQAGFMPMAMALRDETGHPSREWRQFQRQWANPFIVATTIKREALWPN